MRLQLVLDPDRESFYEEATSRLRDVELTDVEAEADALILSDPAAARAAVRPVLLDQPQLCAPSQLAGLESAHLMPAHEWRFYPSVAAVRANLTDGQLGEPGLLRIHHWSVATQEVAPLAFAQLDLARWFFGGTPTHVHALARAGSLLLHLGYPNDGMALIDVASNRPGPAPYYSLHLIGSTGAAYADDHHNNHLHLAADGPRVLLHGQNPLLGILEMLREFVAGIVEDRPWSVGLHDTQEALTTLDAATHV